MVIKKNIDQGVLKEIIQSLENMNYGELIITIHDSDVVQVERREKKRFKARKLLNKQS